MFHLTVFFIINIFLFAGLNFAFSFAEIKTKIKADEDVHNFGEIFKAPMLP